LKRLGDSQKVQEKIATGKFGLGFSSVPYRSLFFKSLIFDRFMDGLIHPKF
jgi:hypothetical protein